MADFYTARDTTMTPLPWPSIAPPFTVRAAVGHAGEQFGLLEQADAAEQRGGEAFVFHRGEPDAAAFECLP